MFSICEKDIIPRAHIYPSRGWKQNGHNFWFRFHKSIGEGTIDLFVSLHIEAVTRLLYTLQGLRKSVEKRGTMLPRAMC